MVPFCSRSIPVKRFFRYTREALQRLLTDQGFHDIQVQTVGQESGPYVISCSIISCPRHAFL